MNAVLRWFSTQWEADKAAFRTGFRGIAAMFRNTTPPSFAKAWRVFAFLGWCYLAYAVITHAPSSFWWTIAAVVVGLYIFRAVKGDR